MQIRPSSALRNDYNAISELAKKTGEPVFITNKGEGDGVFMSVEAFEEREKMFRHRDAIYAAELSRLSGRTGLLPVRAGRAHGGAFQCRRGLRSSTSGRRWRTWRR